MSSPTPDARRYGFIGVIVADRDRHGERINAILGAYADRIVGRLGMPNLENGTLAVITLIVRATSDEVGAITGKLGALEGVSVKSAMHKPLGTSATNKPIARGLPQEYV